jgi:predicted glycosyltransferase
MRRDVAALAAGQGRQALLFHCQHALGIGHLTRSFALAAALARDFRVVFLNGGRMPAGLHPPPSIEIVHLPALGMDEAHALVSHQAGRGLAEAMAARRAAIDAVVDALRPAVLVVELFPFGRKKLTGEILPLIRRVRRDAAAKIVCSLRDILVDARADQQHHDDRARWLAERYFDAVLVHADPALARLEDTFRPRRPLRTPLHYTGYVVPERTAARDSVRGAHLLVSAGGGIVGGGLLRSALAARALLRDPALPMRLVAGPFLPEDEWQALRVATRGMEGIELVRQVPDMALEMRSARASLSQCGYNTALDIVVSGAPALVVPYTTASENEQRARAGRLATLGALQWLDAPAPAPADLAAAIDALLRFRPRPSALDLSGAAESARRLRALCDMPTSSGYEVGHAVV